jgi:hypothetical protein
VAEFRRLLATRLLRVGSSFDINAELNLLEMFKVRSFRFVSVRSFVESVCDGENFSLSRAFL